MFCTLFSVHWYVLQCPVFTIVYRIMGLLLFRVCILLPSVQWSRFCAAFSEHCFTVFSGNWYVKSAVCTVHWAVQCQICTFQYIILKLLFCTLPIDHSTIQRTVSTVLFSDNITIQLALFCKLYNVPSTLYTVSCTLYNVKCTLYSETSSVQIALLLRFCRMYLQEVLHLSGRCDPAGPGVPKHTRLQPDHFIMWRTQVKLTFECIKQFDNFRESVILKAIINMLTLILGKGAVLLSINPKYVIVLRV